MEKARSWGFEIRIASLLFIVAAAIVGIPRLMQWKTSRDLRLVGEGMIQNLRVPASTEEGFGVGDVAELHRRGQISREVAEADTAPWSPLVPSPVPFHGYSVRALTSIPGTSGDEPFPLKGMKRYRDEFAICIPPATPGPGADAWIPCSGGELRCAGGEPAEAFALPSMTELRKTWAIVD